MPMQAQSHTHTASQLSPHPGQLYHGHTHIEPHTSLDPHAKWPYHSTNTSKRYAPSFSLTHPTHAASHPSGLQPLCRVDFLCHTGGHSTQGDKYSRPHSGHSDPHSDRVTGCTSPPGSAKETLKVSAGRDPRNKMGSSLQDAHRPHLVAGLFPKDLSHHPPDTDSQ